MTDSIQDIDALCESSDLKTVISIIGEVAIRLSTIISLGDLYVTNDTKVGLNFDGDEQKSLDLIADHEYFNALKASPVAAYVSEEREDVTVMNKSGTLLLAIDPLDGSSNIETNLSIGSIFSIREYKPGSLSKNISEQFLLPGHYQIAAGYIIFGPQTILVVTTGNGVLQYVLNWQARQFLLTKSSINVPVRSEERR